MDCAEVLLVAALGTPTAAEGATAGAVLGALAGPGARSGAAARAGPPAGTGKGAGAGIDDSVLFDVNVVSSVLFTPV